MKVQAKAFFLAAILTGITTTFMVGCDSSREPLKKPPTRDTVEARAEALENKASPDGDNMRPNASQIITKAEVQTIDPAGKEPLDEAIICLSRTIYWEAKGEGAAGMEGIANVVMNRLGHEGFPSKICNVVTQGREQGSCQFSWWCDGRSDDVEEEKPYAIAKEVARKALNQQLADRTGGALYFHHRRQTPFWAAAYLKTARIGDHLFYKPPGGDAK